MKIIYQKDNIDTGLDCLIHFNYLIVELDGYQGYLATKIITYYGRCVPEPSIYQKLLYNKEDAFDWILNI